MAKVETYSIPFEKQNAILPYFYWGFNLIFYAIVFL